MKKALLGFLLVTTLPALSFAEFCTNCIFNQAALQSGAQFHISSGTVEGKLTVGEIVVTTLTMNSLTAGVFTGSGTFLTNLNASQILTGTLPSARVAGAYSGLTGVGDLTSGSWKSSVIGTQYGGTGQNFVTASTGMIPYFSNVGTMAALAPAGSGVLITQGATLPPAWTTAPAITGANVTAIPLTNLSAGTLPTTIAVNDVNISTLAASKVIGNISGGAATLTIPLPIGNLAGGTLPTSNAASSVTAIVGLQPGTFGGPNNLAQFHVNYDGRISTASQYNLVVYSTNIVPGALPAGVTIPAAQVTAGTLPNNVITSSVATTGIGAGTFGGPAQTLTLAIQTDGRISTVTAQNIALPPSQLSAGTLPSNVLVPAVNVQAGSLANNVIASSLAVNGVTPGVYGGPTVSAQLTIGVDGRVTNATQFSIAGSSGNGAFVNQDNAWSHAQTSFSSWTILSALSATTLAGNGTLITALTPANISAGSLGAGVIASSIAVNSVTNASIVSVATSKIDLSTVTTSIATKVSKTGDTMTGTLTLSNTSLLLTGAAGTVTSASSVTAAAFFGDGSHLTGVSGETNYFAPAKTFGSSVTVATALLAGSSVNASAFFGDGSHLTGVTGETNYFAPAKTFGSSVTVATSILAGSSVNAGAFYGDVTNTTGQSCQKSGNPTLLQILCAKANGNSVTNNDCTVSGGGGNACNADAGTISGGANNGVGGAQGTVPGGNENVANGTDSFAAGNKAKANHDGSFVLADFTPNTALNSQSKDSLTARFTNGYFLNGASVTAFGYITAVSSVNASAFFGDGSHLTGITVSSTVSTTASLYGDGSTALPLGVKSSSVAVLSGGFVLNSQIDPSSVTKQGFVSLANLSGAVPSGRVDFSTITTALDAKASTGTDNSMTRANALATMGASQVTFTGSSVTLSALAASVASVSGGLTASSGTFTATGATQFSVQTSSGIRLLAGIIKLPDGTVIYSTSQFTSGSGISGSGTTGFVPVFTGATSIGNSILQQSGTDAAFNATPSTGTRTLVSGGLGGDHNAAAQNSAIIGGVRNSIAGNAIDGVIIGGGDNVITGDIGPTESGIFAGVGNYVLNVYAVSLGGSGNIVAGESAATIGGESIIASGYESIVAGGESNVAGSSQSFTGGGLLHVNNGDHSTILGGNNNTIIAGSLDGGILGSNSSFILAGSASASILGGFDAIAGGQAGTVLGGQSSHATGDYSYAAGYLAHANAKGSYVLTDSQTVALEGNTTNQMSLRFQNGVALQGVYLSSTTQGSIACDAGSAAFSVTAGDQHGKFLVSGAATNCTVTFSVPWPTDADCLAGSDSDAVTVTAQSATSFTVNGNPSLTGQTITYICAGSQ